ncbi:hypothetical protein OROGR_028943 [Orobanche gracilis]
MASDQARRENVTDERKIEVERDRVPKMTTHFESLADKTREDQPIHGERVDHRQFETAVPAVRVVGVKKDDEEEEESRGRHGPSLEEISNLRASAQQNSAEAIRAAEERYHKAKDSQKDTAVEKTQKSHQAGEEESTEGGVLKDTVMEKSQQAKDVLSSTARYAAEKANAAKGTTMDASKTAAGCVSEKAASTKDAAVEGGKGAAGYAGKVASGVKDQALVSGWGATQYTMEKAAEATKAAADLTSSVAGYTKDKVAGAGQTVAGYAGEKLAAAKDTVVASEEKAAEYAARKKAESRKDMDGKILSHEKPDIQQHEAGGRLETPSKDYFQGVEQGERQGGEQKPKQAGGGGTVFHAIGETIVEIGQTTKNLLVGHDQYPVEQKEHEEGEAYTGRGEGI